MRLNEYLSKINENERLYIGSKSGFFFIGYKNDLNNSYNKIETKIKTEYKKRIKLAEQELSRINNYINSKFAKQKLSNTDKKEIQVLKNKIKKIELKIRGFKVFLSSDFKPLLERRILSIYHKTTMPDELGIAIQLEGIEAGKYWTYQEYMSDN